MMTYASWRCAAVAACSIAILVVVAADLSQSSNAVDSSAASAAGHHRRFAFPLRSAMEVYAASKDAGGSERNGYPSSSDELFADYGEMNGEEQLAPVARRGFRNGGRDRFSHGFGRKRSVDSVAWAAAAAKPDLIDRFTSDESEASVGHLRRPVRAASRRDAFSRGG